jgi:hypothetical protein
VDAAAARLLVELRPNPCAEMAIKPFQTSVAIFVSSIVRMFRRSVGAVLAPARSSLRAFASWPTPNLAVADPEAFKIIKAEEARQKDGITLIPSENYASTAVLQALGSCLTNKYSEGYPGARYYGGNEQIDNMERCVVMSPPLIARFIASALNWSTYRLCHSRAMKVFGLDASKWGVNVQTLSGSPANFAGPAHWHVAAHRAASSDFLSQCTLVSSSPTIA